MASKNEKVKNKLGSHVSTPLDKDIWILQLLTKFFGDAVSTDRQTSSSLYVGFHQVLADLRTYKLDTTINWDVCSPITMWYLSIEVGRNRSEFSTVFLPQPILFQSGIGGFPQEREVWGNPQDTAGTQMAPEGPRRYHSKEFAMGERKRSSNSSEMYGGSCNVLKSILT